MHKVVIIEDEPLAAKRLHKLLLNCQPDSVVLAQLPSVEEALDWFANPPQQPTLVLADVELADGKSFDIFEQVKLSCPIIFTTAYNAYAIDAFALHSIDYLLKPISQQKLAASLKKIDSLRLALQAEATPKQPQNWQAVEALVQQLNQQQTQYKQRFMVKNGQRISSIKVNEIAYFTVEDKVTMLYTHTESKYPLDYSLDELAQQLDPASFFRANRKYLLHIDAVMQIAPYFKGRMLLHLLPATTEDVVVSADRTPLFKDWLDQ